MASHARETRPPQGAGNGSASIRRTARGRLTGALGLALAGAIQLAGTAPAARAEEYPACVAPRELLRFRDPLPHLVRAVGASKIVRIIALGSSSTAGSGASSPSASYPARLDSELDHRFPGRDFQVANFGTGGQLATDMLARIHTDILPRPPDLVIWQTGVNDAIQDVGVDAFRETLVAGIRALRAAGIDVILVNQQYYPRSDRISGYSAYLGAMQKVADLERVPLFRRYGIMKHFVKTGQFKPEQLLAPDNFHMNDLSYGCLADLLADAIGEQVRQAYLTAMAHAPAKASLVPLGH